LAAKHCSILFSSVLRQPERFYACRQLDWSCQHLQCRPGNLGQQGRHLISVLSLTFLSVRIRL
jgi:hypothetical protein